MNMKAVKSSNVQAVGYDDETKTLRVTFKGGGSYDYSGVELKTYNALLAADADKDQSVGSFLHRHIKPNYKCQKCKD